MTRYAKFMPLMVGITHALPEISVNCGQLTLHGYNSCEIYHNDKFMHYAGPEKKIFPDLVFGLIRFRCDHEAGYFMSEFNCEECNYACCNAENNPTDCQTNVTQSCLGVFLGAALSILIGAFIYKWLTAHDFNSELKTIVMRDEKTSFKGNSRENDGEREVENCSNLSTDEDENVKRNCTRTPKTVLKTTWLSIIASLLSVGLTNACDVVIFVESDNVTMICHTNSSICETKPYFTLQKGQEVCIEDHFGERVSLVFSDIVWRHRYELIYYTSDYIINMTSKSQRCSECSTDCYNELFNKLIQHHTPDIGHSKLCTNCIPISDDYSEDDSEEVYSNYSLSLREIVRTGDLFKVFKRKSLVRMVTITKKGLHAEEIILGDYDTTYHLDMKRFKFYPESTMPINGIKSSLSSYLPFLLQYDKKLYYINGSEINEPKSSTFGDVQFSLDDLGVKYSMPMGTCLESCSEGCSAKGLSMMSNFQAQNYRQSIDFIVRNNDSSLIDTFETLERGEVTLRLGNFTLHTLETMKGKCNVKYVGNFGCTSCNKNAYLVFGINKIETEGLIPFKSNCSFDRDSIKCDFEPTKLILKGNSSVCYIRIPSVNQQFVVNLKYFNFGHDNKSQEQNSVIGKQLIVTFFGTMLLFFIFGLILFTCLQFHKSRPLYTATFVKRDDLVSL